MKIQILSDLHLEFLSPTQIKKLLEMIEAKAPVLVLAGDIGNPYEDHYKQFLTDMASRFEKIFLVAGNHEYYGHDVHNTNQQLKTICQSYSNVSFLCHSYEDYQGIHWIGTTLWSSIQTPRYYTNDIRCIKKMTMERFNEMHRDSVFFLHQTMAHTKGRCVIITHYLPTMKVIHEKYRNQTEMNQWFASSSLEDFLEKYTEQIPLWIYGHTHSFSDQQIQQTHMVCNPLGYENENNEFHWNYVVDLESSGDIQ